MKNKPILILLSMLFLMVMAISPILAEPLDNTADNTIIVNTVNTIDNTVNNTVDNTVTNILENTVINNPEQVVTFDDLVNRIILKLNQILEAMKAIAQPVILILFIAAAVTSLFGALSKKGSVWKGVGAMLVAGLVFSAITYADVIVALFTSWLVS